MGLYVRKSLSVGPFRFNFSKSGIGVSTGLKGLRVGMGPRGHYIQLGKAGLYYRATLPASAIPKPLPQSPAPALSPSKEAMETIDSAPVSEMQDTSAAALLDELNNKTQRPNYWKWAAGILAVFVLVNGLNIFFWLGLVVVLYLAIRDQVAKTTVLCFSLDDQGERACEQFYEALASMTASKGMWRVNAQGKILDLKYNAGASSQISREVLVASRGLPSGVKSNIDVPILKSSKLALYFMPDRLLVKSPQGYGAIAYVDLKISGSPTQFIESSHLPDDADVIGHTWQYVNKSGGPDKRFKDNPCYPIARYEEIHFSSSSGLNEVMMVSRQKTATPMSEALAELGVVTMPGKAKAIELKPKQMVSEEDESFATFQLREESDNHEVSIPPAPSFLPSTPPTHSQATQQTTGNWVPAGKNIDVHGFSLPDGMIYCGFAFKANDWEIEPALIDPTLPVARHPVDEKQLSIPYWPSYSEVTPEVRRSYLQWLAGGRNNPTANIGLVMMFYYGLERRIFVDIAENSNLKPEIDIISSEVQRLLTIYGDNHSFSRYATSLLSYLAADSITEKSYLNPIPKTTVSSYELPLSYRLALGQMAVDRHPLPVEWALAWIFADSSISKRTPVVRCPNMFASLFSEQYQQKYGDGFMLPVNRTKLRATYSAASPCIREGHTREVGGLPDLGAVSGPQKKLQAIVDQCTEVLEPYSRYLGRNPDKTDSLEALLLLPVEHWPESVRAELMDLKRLVEANILSLSFTELMGKMKSAGPLSRDKVIGLASALEAQGIGMEPDVLAGAKTPKADESIVLFKTVAEDSSARATAVYHAASVTLDLACTVAMADGYASEAELGLLHRQIESWAHLSAGHHCRLKARLQLQVKQPPTLASLKKKLEPLPEDVKRSIARLLAHLAQADGIVSTDEVKLLERVYKTLQLDVKLVYSDLHALPSTPSVLVHEEGAPAKVGNPSSFILNAERIAALQKETEQVSALLSDVFMEEPQLVETATEHLETEDTTTDHGMLGLDNDHAIFARRLISRSQWSRAELADLAADLDLMLDGALERVNEGALDLWDEPLVEGDDPIEINQELLEKLSA